LSRQVKRKSRFTCGRGGYLDGVDTNSYVLFLILGIVLVAADGQIIYRSGLRYLENSYTDENSAGSMARLVSVLFHLAVLGVLALISTVDFSADSPLEGVVFRLGVALIVLAIGHAIAIRVLTRMRDRLDAERMSQRRFENANHVEPETDSYVKPARGDLANP
jgi:hypothetical protein